MKAKSLASRVTLAVVLLVVISLGLLGGLSIAVARHVARGTAGSADLRMATLTARAVERYVGDAVSVVREAPTRPKLGAEIRRGDWSEAAVVLVNLVRHFPQFERIILQDGHGIVRACVPCTDLVGQDFGARAFFRDAKAVRTFHIAGLEAIGPEGRPVIPIAVPVFEPNGSATAVLTGALSAATLGQFLLRLGPDSDGNLLLVDRGGSRIAGSREAAPLLASMAARHPIGQAVTAGRVASLEFQAPGSGEYYFGAYVPVPGPSWGVVAVRPAAHVYAEADRLAQWLSAIVVACSVGAALVGVWLSRSLSRPLQGLSAAAERLAGGDFSSRMPQSGPAEVVATAGAFNRMAAELERTYADLERRDAALRLMFTRNPLPIFLYDLETLFFLEVNEAMTAFYGYTRDELLRMRVTEISPPEDVDRMVEYVRSGLRGYLHSGQWRHRRKNGEIVEVQAVSSSFEFAGRQARLVASTDVTARAAAEREVRRLAETLELRVAQRTAQLEAANGELESFTYTVSHDLKAPLRGMAGYAQALVEDHATALDEDGRRYLGLIQQGATRMGELIDDLLRYSRLERRTIKREPVALRALAERVVEDAAHDAEASSLSIDLRIGAERVEGEREGLREALANLVSNAVKFSPSGGTVTLDACALNGEVILSVADQGIGFDMKYHDRIFQIFERLHRQEEYGGTGVGLAIVRKVAERHGGRAWAVSERGKGSTFFLAMPITRASDT